MARQARKREWLAKASVHDAQLVLELIEAKLREMGYEVVLHSDPHAWVEFEKIDAPIPGSAGLPQDAARSDHGEEGEETGEAGAVGA